MVPGSQRPQTEHEGYIFIAFLKLKVLYIMLLLLLTHLRVRETSPKLLLGMREERKYCVIFCLDAHVSAFRMCGESRAFCHN